MLQHFQAGHGRKAGRTLDRELLHRNAPVIHFHSAFEQMQPGHGQRRFPHVDAGHRCAAPRHALGQDAAPAADIQYGFPGQADALVNPVQAQRIDVVKRLEFRIRIPPAAGQRLEFGDFGRVDIGLAGG